MEMGACKTFLFLLKLAVLTSFMGCVVHCANFNHIDNEYNHVEDLPYNPLGPGNSLDWEVVDPSLVGLSASALDAAVKSIADVAAPFCLAVVKHGALVVDHVYPGYAEQTSPGSTEPKGPRYIETMSAGKTITAGLIGSAITAGLFDLDTPMVQYGVKPHADFNKTGTDYFPQLTARHTLAQNTGIGTYPPGTALRYDSSQYIAHLSWLLNKTASMKTNLSARSWATERFASPLGVPTLYANQAADPLHMGDTPDEDAENEICAGGLSFLIRDLLSKLKFIRLFFNYSFTFFLCR